MTARYRIRYRAENWEGFMAIAQHRFNLTPYEANARTWATTEEAKAWVFLLFLDGNYPLIVDDLGELRRCTLPACLVEPAS